MFIVIHHFFFEPGSLEKSICILKRLHQLYFPFLNRAIFSQGLHGSLVLHSFWINQNAWEQIKQKPPEGAEGLIQQLQEICFQVSLIHKGEVLMEQNRDIR